MPALFRKKSPDAAVTDPDSPESTPGTPTGSAPVGEADDALAERHILTNPSAQNALDLFAGEWKSALPAILGLRAGEMPLFDDGRIHTILANLDSIKNTKVLELAPLEGGHTYILHEAGARVHAIESRTHEFLRCLVVKEILNLNRAHFHLGDFRAYLADTTDRFDMAVCSGVLHEQTDPLALLEGLSRVTDRVAIWTHYWDASRASDAQLAGVVDADAHVEECHGSAVKMHAVHAKNERGDESVYANWLERDALLTALSTLGYSTVRVLEDQADHPGGPAILLIAER